jgi:hypothetical protein
MGNVALGSGAGRKIYVRPGTAGANVDMEGTGAGGYLAVAAGNAEHHSALHRGGHLYLYGGNYSGTPAGPIPAYGYQGNVHLAYDESSAAVGRVGIRKAAPQAATEDYDVHVDVNGNVRTNGDIMWGDAGSVPGWKVMWNGAYTMTPPTIPFRFFVIDGGGYIIELTSGNLGSSNMYIRCKRVGSFAILNFRLEFNGVAPMSGREHAFMAWDPSNPQVSWLGSILPQRTTPFTDPTEASYSSAIDRYNSVVFKPCSVDAAYSATATWSGAIPANRNVVHFYSTPAFGAYSHICGQIVMEMTL